MSTDFIEVFIEVVSLVDWIVSSRRYSYVWDELEIVLLELSLNDLINEWAEY